QYVLAADRNNDSLGQLYDPLHPSLLRLLARVIRAGNRAGKQVTLCGEIGGDPKFASLLVALGLTDFSMHPGRILNMRDALARCNQAALRELAPRLLKANSREEVAELLAV
ncbi:MAG TPA: putative PEP-binding protein, partial [Rhodanobacteraceae bacterium]|nr:putative PEP-binding protein [Rhodanobacteraceae bacterium]